MKNTYRVSAVLLIVLAIAMIGLSIKMGGLPPGITGAGFIVIAWVFWNKSKL